MVNESVTPEAEGYVSGTDPIVTPGGVSSAPQPPQPQTAIPMPPTTPLVDEAAAERQAQNTVEFISEALKASEGDTSLKGMGLTDAEKLAFKNAMKSFLIDTGWGNMVSRWHGYIMVPVVSAMITLRRLFYWRKKKMDEAEEKKSEIPKIKIGGIGEGDPQPKIPGQDGPDESPDH